MPNARLLARQNDGNMSQASADRLRAARKAMKTEIRKAKREMWQNFLSNAQRDDV
jgi:hypothetical protein